MRDKARKGIKAVKELLIVTLVVIGYYLGEVLLYLLVAILFPFVKTYQFIYGLFRNRS